jgi:hypothetical protein
MDRSELLRLVKTKDYDQDKLIGWINAMSPNTYPKSPIHNKVGDIYMHPIFLHPCVLLEKQKDGSWICGLLTTEPTCPEIFCNADSRFVGESYFTTALFSVQEPNGRFFAVYDNDKHLKKVLKNLRKLLK